MPTGNHEGSRCSQRNVAAGLVPLILVGWLTGCGGAARVEPQPQIAPQTVAVPPGVDSSVAAFADSLADASFVSLPRQEQATTQQNEGRLILERSDSLWLAFSQMEDSTRSVSPDDSSASTVAATTGGMALIELDSLIRNSHIDAVELAEQTGILLDSAEAALEEAFRINPFDTRNKLWLSRVYELQARRLGQSEAYTRAIDELEKLSRLTPDQHTVFAMLANNYFRLEDLRRAAEAYGQAEHVYLSTYDLVLDSNVTPDSALLYDYASARADMHMQNRSADAAGIALDDAMGYARTTVDSSHVAGEIEWMNWDDGNLTSSFARDSLASVEETGNLDAARTGYETLLGQLTAQPAFDEIDWRLAIVDYNLGNSEAAALRLQHLVARIEADSTGTPTDSTNVRYFNDYGTVCLNLARDFLHDRRDNRTALMYYEQATRIEWTGRAVAYLELANLLRSNEEAALANGNLALARDRELTVDQRKNLYRLLMGLYRRSGQFEQARRFRDAYRAVEAR
jgi:tetratricopeptide (TPR) repeat protein